MASTFGSDRTWKSLKERFLNHISCNLKQYNMSRPDIWRIEDALGLLDVKKLLCDTDMDNTEVIDEDVRSRVLKKRRTHDATEDQSNTEEEFIGDLFPKSKRRGKRKLATIPTDSFDSSNSKSKTNVTTNSSTTVQSSSSTSKVVEEGYDGEHEQAGNDEDLNLLLNNTDLVPQLRGFTSAESSASPSASISKPTDARPPSGTQPTNVQDVYTSLASALDVPSAEKFSAGLRQVSSRSMSNDQELSMMGVTSTIRKDDIEDEDENKNSDALNKTQNDDFDIEERSGILNFTGNSQILLVNNNSSVSLRHTLRSQSNNNSVVSNLGDADNGEIM